MKPIRVLHLITKLELGGAQRNTLYTWRHLDRNRFETFLACGPGGQLTPTDCPRTGLFIINNLIREIRPWRDIQAFFSLIKLLRQLQPTVLHTHSSKAGILGRLAAKLCKTPVVIHSVHGFSFAPTQGWLRRKLYTWSERLLAPMTDHFIFVANADITTAQQKKLIATNFSLIRSGFPLEPFRMGIAHPFWGEQFPLQNKLVCGVIAPFKPQKGLDHLIEIARLVIAERPQVVFFLAGDGSLRMELEKKICLYQLREHFFLPGFIEAIEGVVPWFDIGVSTALWEGLPQSLIQLRLAKKPLVVSDIPGNREVVHQGKNGFLVPVTEYRTFANQLIRLIDDIDLRQRLGSYPEDFSAWEGATMVRQQERLYQQLVTKTSNGRGCASQ